LHWLIYPNVNVTGKLEKMDDYKSRVESQIRQYEFVENIHELPPIFHYFSHDHIRPRVEEVFDAGSIRGISASGMSQGVPRNGSYCFVSISSDDASYEIEVAKELVADGYVDFAIECTEISPIMRTVVPRSGSQPLACHSTTSSPRLHAGLTPEFAVRWPMAGTP